MNRHPGARWAACSLIALVIVAQTAGVVVPSWRQSTTVLCLLPLDLFGATLGLRAAGRGPHRAGWLLVSTGRSVAILANSLLGAADAHHSHGLFWAGAACGSLMYAAYALGALAFPAQRLLGRQRAWLASETVTVLGCGFMYVWYLVLRPHLQTEPGWRWPVSVGFPIGDLVLLIALSTAVLRGGLRAVGRPAALLIAGLSLYLFADVAFNATGYDGSTVTGSVPATVLVVVASLCMTLAALWAAVEPAPDEAAPGRRPLTAPWFSYLPYAAVAAGLTLMVAITLSNGQILTWGGLVLGLVLMTAGVAVRQIFSLRDSQDRDGTDALTGLANLVGLGRYARKALVGGQRMAGLYFDLDAFKRVNDVHGLDVGDRLLVEFAELLRTSIRDRDFAARIGADEFVVLLRDVTDVADAIALARRVQSAAADRPLRIGDHDIYARVSVGISMAEPGDADEDLRRRCDAALYQAKRSGEHGYVVYEPGMVGRQAEEEALARELDDAVGNGQLRVLFQPMTDLNSGRTIGFEALVRWQHPRRGLVSPLDFIPIAERTGAITAIGLHVLEQACAQVHGWNQQPAAEPVYVSVNLAARQLQDPALVGLVLAVLARTGLPARHLVLEVTESAIVDDRTAVPTLRALREHGIRVAIDDFGTGYSSLQYLTRLPVDILKIDRAFVAELDGTRHGSAIAEAVIRLAQILGLTTVAEGVETTAQAGELRRLGCRTGQGYLYAKPLTAEDARRHLDQVVAPSAR